MAANDPQRGIVFIAQQLDMDDTMEPLDLFTAHWEDPFETPPVPLEDGPEFSAAEEAIQWGRERARVVLIRVGPLPQVYYSAGDDPPESHEPETVEPHAPVPPWPPGSHS